MVNIIFYIKLWLHHSVEAAGWYHSSQEEAKIISWDIWIGPLPCFTPPRPSLCITHVHTYRTYKTKCGASIHKCMCHHTVRVSSGGVSAHQMSFFSNFYGFSMIFHDFWRISLIFDNFPHTQRVFVNYWLFLQKKMYY